MAVFRAPSVSSVSDCGSTSGARGSSSQVQRRNSSRISRRPRSGLVRPSNVDLAASKARRKRIDEMRPPSVPSDKNYVVYVGNISSRTSCASLKKLFSVCGTVLKVVVRQTISKTVEEPGVGTLYATILFSNKDGHTKALLMKGAVLDGCELAVGLSVWDIPEPHRLRNKPSEEHMPANQPLCRKPTVILEEAQRMPVMGSSFSRKDLGTSALPNSRGKDEKKLSTIPE